MKTRIGIVRNLLKILGKGNEDRNKVFYLLDKVLKGKAALPVEWEDAILGAAEINSFDKLREMYPKVIFRKGLIPTTDMFKVRLSVIKPEGLVKSTDFPTLLSALEALKKLGLEIELKAGVPD